MVPKKNSPLKKTLFYLNLVSLALQLFLMSPFKLFIDSTPLNLFVPIVCLVNLLFFVYWLLRMQWPFLLFLFSFGIQFKQWSLLYQLPHKEKESEEGLKIMSFNVRLFNLYGWIKEDDIPGKIEDFIQSEQPDIICFQEFAKSESPAFKEYPYQHFQYQQQNGSRGLHILSKIPLIQSGFIPFENTTNDGIYSNVVWKGDTLRIYNLHLESLKINTRDSVTPFSGKRFVKKIKSIFAIQQQQASTFNNFASKSTYPAIICSDINNNAFSKTYRTLAANRNDAYTLFGKGIGGTYSFWFFPLRIDYIFTDMKLEVLSFKTLDVSLSDHKPITATVKMKKIE